MHWIQRDTLWRNGIMCDSHINWLMFHEWGPNCVHPHSHLQLLSCVLWFQKETSAVNTALSICRWLFFRVQLSILNGAWPDLSSINWNAVAPLVFCWRLMPRLGINLRGSIKGQIMTGRETYVPSSMLRLFTSSRLFFSFLVFHFIYLFIFVKEKKIILY